jgi:hypothetical protein
LIGGKKIRAEGLEREKYMIERKWKNLAKERNDTDIGR